MVDARKWIQDLDDSEWEVRYNAVSALEELSRKEPQLVEPAISKLIERLDDPYDGVWYHAARALSNIAAVDALEPLSKLTSSSKTWSQNTQGQVTKEAISKIKRRSLPSLLQEVSLHVMPESIGPGEVATISIEVTNSLNGMVKDLVIDLSQAEPYFELSEKIVNFPPLGRGGRIKKYVEIRPSPVGFLGEFAFEVMISSSVGQRNKNLKFTVVSPPLKKEIMGEGTLENYELIDMAPYAIGGFADIFRARDKRSGELVAMKTPRVAKEDDVWKTLDKHIFDEFLSEAGKWSHLKHQNIAELRDFGSTPMPWLAMDFAEEGSLRKRLLSEEGLSTKEVIEIASKLCDALHHAHNLGVVHLDIKPENILFIDGEPKLTDWGTAKSLLYEKVTRSRFTPEYAAPEQLDPTYGEPDRRTDTYQLGVVVYEMLVGKLPFTSESPALLIREILEELPEEPSKANSEVPEELDKIVLKCLAKRMEDRYEVIWLLKEDLERLR